MTTMFTIKVDAIRVTSTGNLTDIVKQVDWTLEGERAGQTFSLPQTTTLGDPDPNNFTPIQALTPEMVDEWIEATCDLNPIKNHINYVLDKEVARASLEPHNLPWAPPTPPTPPVES